MLHYKWNKNKNLKNHKKARCGETLVRAGAFGSSASGSDEIMSCLMISDGSLFFDFFDYYFYGTLLTSLI